MCKCNLQNMAGIDIILILPVNVWQFIPISFFAIKQAFNVKSFFLLAEVLQTETVSYLGYIYPSDVSTKLMNSWSEINPS